METLNMSKVNNKKLKKSVNIVNVNIQLFKINNRNTRKTCETYPELTIKTPEEPTLESFLIKWQAFWPATLLKRDPNTCAFLRIFGNF